MGPRGFEPRSPAPKAGILNQAILRTRIENYRTRLFKLLYLHQTPKRLLFQPFNRKICLNRKSFKLLIK